MSDNEILIEVKNVSKKFSRTIRKSMWYGLKDMTKAMFGVARNGASLRKEEFWAVKDVSFSLRRGECLGLIGRNGAGKSTLLKMLNGLITPDTGEIIIRGKVGALIELGAGFNPILSGRENIYVNGQLLGFSKKAIDERLESIIEFSEIREFIDSPVQNYSSGMKVRLGFAVAAQMEPDVLIIDEVLAVGDLGFILKCFSSIDAILPNTAVIFVSHSMPQVSRICNMILLMDKGETEYLGEDVASGIDKYFARFAQEHKPPVFTRGGDAELLTFTVGADSPDPDNASTILNWLDDLRIFAELKVKKSVPSVYVILTIFDKEGRPVGLCANPNPLSEKNLISSEDEFNIFKINLVVPRVNLSKGNYSTSLVVTEGFRQKPMLRVQSAGRFQVQSKNAIWHPVEFEGHWS